MLHLHKEIRFHLATRLHEFVGILLSDEADLMKLRAIVDELMDPPPPKRPTLQPAAADTYSLCVTVDAALKKDLDELKRSSRTRSRTVTGRRCSVKRSSARSRSTASARAPPSHRGRGRRSRIFGLSVSHIIGCQQSRSSGARTCSSSGARQPERVKVLLLEEVEGAALHRRYHRAVSDRRPSPRPSPPRRGDIHRKRILRDRRQPADAQARAAAFLSVSAPRSSSASSPGVSSGSNVSRTPPRPSTEGSDNVAWKRSL